MRREEEGREVDGEGGGGEAGGEEGGEGGKAVGSIKLIEFTPEFSSQVAPGSQLPDCCRSWLELQTLKPNSFLNIFVPCARPYARDH